jgi:hypothetical protein
MQNKKHGQLKELFKKPRMGHQKTLSPPKAEEPIMT